MTGQPRKTRGYGILHRRFREGRLADAILAKWRSNGDAGQKWDRLERDVDRVLDENEERKRRWLLRRRRGR